MTLALDPATTAIVVVDKINAAGRALVDAARRSGVAIICARPVSEAATAGRAYRNFPFRAALAEETFGGAFATFVPAAGEPVVAMHRDSAFFETRLDSLLRTRGTRTLIVIGVTTNLGVETTAREGYQREYNAIVLADCTAAPTGAEHRVGLRNVARGCGTVAEAADVLAALQAESVR